MANPPLLDGADQLSLICPLPGVTAKLSGVNGKPTGMPVMVAAALAPTPFIARTLKLYDVPLVRPVNVWLTALDAVTHVAPLLLDTWKCVIKLPPLLDGAAQFNMTRPLPGVAVRFLGINAAVATVDGLAVAIAEALAPILFTARTLNV